MMAFPNLLLLAGLLLPSGEREAGLLAYAEGRYADAVTAFRAAIAQEGDSPELQFDLAMALWRAGQHQEARAAAEQYVRLAGKSVRQELYDGLLGAIAYDEAKALEAQADAVASAPPPMPPVVDPNDPQAGAGATPTAPPDPLPMLKSALGKVNTARDNFFDAIEARRTPELLRNAERSLRYAAELQKKIEELEQQREEQKSDDKNDKKDDDKKDDDKKQDDKQDESKDGDQKNDDQKQQQQDPKDQPKDDKSEPKDPSKQDQQGKPDEQPEAKPEPKPGDQPRQEQKQEQQPPPDGNDQAAPKPAPKEGEAKDEPQPQPKDDKDKTADAQKPDGAARQDAPGEQMGGKELTPEQRARLLKELEKLEQLMKDYRAGARQRRAAGDKDW
ncbi:MAG: tetratricopeptide repeat protein [Planctomycetes bacterium]|nr:tetratricopeptide repeat protein [Planctomycetota bacterium]